MTALTAVLMALFAASLAVAQPPSSSPQAASSRRSASEKATPVFSFQDVTREAGIDFEHPPSPEKEYIIEAASGGVALLDYNQDGLLDIYLVNSLTVDTIKTPQRARSALYKNLGNGKFADVSEAAGVAWPGWGVGVCVADVDGDRLPDLYVTGLTGNHLYRNVEGKTFVDITDEAGVAGGGWSTGCGFADYDRDGDLDLFVSRYLDIDFANLPEFGKGQLCTYRGIPVHCGPRGLPGISDLFFKNEAGRFVETSKAVGVNDPEGLFGLGIAWVDVDSDGWLDLFVANDTKRNYLYMNNKDGTFEEMGYLLGVAVSEDGKEQGSMGIAVGDYKNEGRLSLFVTNFAEEYNAFYRNEGSYFQDASFRTSTALSSQPYVGWGTAFSDLDNDGWLDLLLVNGHVYPQMKDLDVAASAPYRQRGLVYRNRRDGTFLEVGEELGGPLTEQRVSRGMAVGDLDNDGRLDVVINELDGKARVLMNRTEKVGNWLLVKLVGKGAMSDAIGALISLRIGKASQLRDLRSGTSYLSQDDMRQHFGLGMATWVEMLEVRWPDGSTSKLKDLEANQVVVIEQPAAEDQKPDPAAEKGT